MLRHKNIDRVCCIILALTLLTAGIFVHSAAAGFITADTSMGYETRLFDQSRVHTIDIVMDDWEAFLQTATGEEYASCHLVIDGESFKNVAIRGKGNTSLSNVAAYGNDRYSFKVEFDHYQSGSTYHGLDKLSLNNLIQDNTYMKDYFAYTLMGKMGVASPLCSFVQINVNGEPWGLYLAVEGVEESFLQRNYGKNYGELYKPDSLSFGGGRGNGRNFDMEEMAEQFGFSFDTENFEMPDASSMPQMPTGGEMPDMSSMMQMPTGGEMPDMGSMPQMPTGGEMPDMSSVPQMSDRGGFGGMGSSDVKLVYTDDNPSSYSNIFDNAKTDITDADKTRLISSLKALGEGDASAVDTEAVIRYMAVHNFLCNDDSYTGSMIHNYYLYEDDGVLEMIPWDYNLAFGGFQGGSNANSLINRDIDDLVTGGSGGDRPMADWITDSAEYIARYHEIYQEFMTTVFDSGWFISEIDRVTEMISPYVQSDPTAFCTYEEFLTGAETLRTFCLKRAESVSLQLDGASDQVDASGLVISSMGSMGGGMGFGKGGGTEFPSGGDFSRRGKETGGWSRSSEKATGSSETASPEETSKPAEKETEKTPRDAQGMASEFVRQSGQDSDNGWLWLTACAVLLAGAILLAWKYPGKR